MENWNLLFEKKKKKHENLREIWFSGYFSLILNSLQYDLKNKEEWKLSFLNYEKILEKDMYAWYVNNPVPVSLLSGDRKPQIRFLGNHHSGSGNLYHKSFRM